MRKCERVDELELVVEVVLEPEHDLVATAQRVEELRIAQLERREDGRSASDATLGEEVSPRSEQLAARQLGDRALVKGVAPRKHGAAERRLSQRLRGAVAVRDVEQGQSSATIDGDRASQNSPFSHVSGDWVPRSGET